jgi:hypothetical protein
LACEIFSPNLEQLNQRKRKKSRKLDLEKSPSFFHLLCFLNFEAKANRKLRKSIGKPEILLGFQFSFSRF